MLEPGTITGTLKPEFAQRLKLGQETTVVLAAADTQSALIGTGALQNGDVTVVNGSTTPIQMVVDNLLIDPQLRIWSGPYLPGKWVLESNCGKTGMVYRQYLKIIPIPAPVCAGSQLSMGHRRDCDRIWTRQGVCRF